MSSILNRQGESPYMRLVYIKTPPSICRKTGSRKERRCFWWSWLYVVVKFDLCTKKLLMLNVCFGAKPKNRFEIYTNLQLHCWHRRYRSRGLSKHMLRNRCPSKRFYWYELEVILFPKFLGIRNGAFLFPETIIGAKRNGNEEKQLPIKYYTLYVPISEPVWDQV